MIERKIYPQPWTFVAGIALLILTFVLIGRSEASTYCVVMATSQKSGDTFHLAGPDKQLEKGWKTVSSITPAAAKTVRLASPVASLIETQKNGGYAFLVVPTNEAPVVIDIIKAMELIPVRVGLSTIPVFLVTEDYHSILVE